MIRILIDILIISLLIASLGYGVTVTRQLKLLMVALKEIEPLVQEFSVAVDKSETSVNKMKENLATVPAKTPNSGHRQAEQHVPRESKKPASGPARAETQARQDTKGLVKSFFAETLAERRA